MCGRIDSRLLQSMVLREGRLLLLLLRLFLLQRQRRLPTKRIIEVSHVITLLLVCG